MGDGIFGNGDPETHIGQLSNASLRDARFLLGDRACTRGGMSGWRNPERTVHVTRAPPGSAGNCDASRAARGTYDPGVPQLHAWASWMIRKSLGADWSASRGASSGVGATSTTRFLSYGGPPIPDRCARAMLGKDVIWPLLF